jgi:homoserine dehydrogenase
MKILRLCVLGYGNAGKAFGKLLAAKHDEIMRVYGTDVRIVAIATKSKGVLAMPDGIDLASAEDPFGFRIKSGMTGQSGRDGMTEKSGRGGMTEPDRTALDLAKTGDYDVLIELTPLDIFTGQPATDHIRAALSRGKHAVSANKGPIAWAYRELADLAAANGVRFYFETAVMDGTPVFDLVDETLRMCKVTEIGGILNSTTNFILEKMADGVPMDDIMEEGRRRGFVEADPSMDTLGWDAAAKTTALMNVLMDARITPMDVRREGVENVTPERIADARSRGKVVKLVCRGSFENGRAVGEVGPQEVDKGDLFATITGTTSVVSITTDLMGTVSIVEHEPEIEQTAYGIFSDVLRIITQTKRPATFCDRV